jgi:hypothetical protein
VFEGSGNLTGEEDAMEEGWEATGLRVAFEQIGESLAVGNAIIPLVMAGSFFMGWLLSVIPNMHIINPS